MLHPRSAAGSAALYFLSGAALAQPAPSQPDTGEITLPEVTVNAPRVSLGSYLTPATTTALRVPAPTQDVPVSVQTVPQALIQDRQALTVRQAIETVSGVESSHAIPGSLAFRIRGFVDSGSSLRDGFREQSNQQDIQGVERIDVLKGPPSVLYGSTLSSGGVANIVIKAPVDGNFVRTGTLGGSFGLFRQTLDANQDLTGDGKVVVRLNAAYDQADSFRRYGSSEDKFVNPVLRLRPTDQDEVVLHAQYYHSDFNYGQYQSPISQKTLGLPLSFSFVDPNLTDTHKDAWRTGFDWTHSFDSGIKFRSGFNASVVNYDIGSSRFFFFPVAANGLTVSRTVTRGPQRGQDYDWQNELSGAFSTGPLKHQWLAGLEASRSNYNSKGFNAALPPLSLVNPVYYVVPGRFTPNSRLNTRLDDLAGYFQDFVTVTPEVRLLVGGRYDVTDTASNNLLAHTRSAGAANHVSPRVGVVYEPVPTTALYANWANSFIPTTATTAAGAALPPSTSKQYEVGVKQQFADKRVQATAALFQITRTNVPTPNLTNTLFSTAAGEQRSRGLELDVAGELRPGWKVTAAYAYTFANVVKDNRIPVGNTLAGVARHAGTLWTSYEMQEGSVLPGFGVGFGVRAETKRDATLPNTFKLPGYVRLDAAAWYRFHIQGRPVRAQVNVQNLTDARIYDTDGGATLRPTPPLSVLGGLTADF